MIFDFYYNGDVDDDGDINNADSLQKMHL